MKRNATKSKIPVFVASKKCEAPKKPLRIDLILPVASTDKKPPKKSKCTSNVVARDRPKRRSEDLKPSKRLVALKRCRTEPCKQNFLEVCKTRAELRAVYDVCQNYLDSLFESERDGVGRLLSEFVAKLSLLNADNRSDRATNTPDELLDQYVRVRMASSAKLEELYRKPGELTSSSACLVKNSGTQCSNGNKASKVSVRRIRRRRVIRQYINSLSSKLRRAKKSSISLTGGRKVIIMPTLLPRKSLSLQEAYVDGDANCRSYVDEADASKCYFYTDVSGGNKKVFTRTSRNQCAFGTRPKAGHRLHEQTIVEECTDDGLASEKTEPVEKKREDKAETDMIYQRKSSGSSHRKHRKTAETSKGKPAGQGGQDAAQASLSRLEKVLKNLEGMFDRRNFSYLKK